MARSMVRLTLGAVTIAGITCAASAIAAPPPGHGHGHGALRAALVADQPQWFASQCQAAAGGTAQGFAVLNAPGKPGGAPSRVIGTVSLKHAPEHSASFAVQLGTRGTCTTTGATLTTNEVGNGTAHFDVQLPAGSTATSYYVVLQQQGALPSLPVPVPLPSVPLPMREYYATPSVTLS